MTTREFVNEDLAGAVFREVDLTGARMYGVLLTDADLDGDITGLRVNGVEIGPLVEAELDRLHPERAAFRPSTPDGLREALRQWDELWQPTLARAVALGEDALHTRVNGEWSFVETRRHLIFVVDKWFGQAVLGDPHGFHPIGLPAELITDGADTRLAFADVEEILAGRIDKLREYAATATQEDLDRPCSAPGSSSGDRTVIRCIRTIFNDGWEHHRFAVRDLATLEAAAPGRET